MLYLVMHVSFYKIYMLNYVLHEVIQRFSLFLRNFTMSADVFSKFLSFSIIKNFLCWLNI